MSLDKVLITGSCGLVGSESVRCFADLGCEVVGIDNNHRKDWFGEEGDTSPVKVKLKELPNYRHMNLNVVDEYAMREVIKEEQPDLIIHAAAQPSHEKSSEIPLADFKVNALGTINLLEATRTLCPNAIFVFVSTNKVYGDLDFYAKLPEETTKRYMKDPDPPKDRMVFAKTFMGEEDWIYTEWPGVDTNFGIDQTLHTPFGASKAAADLMVQEYGRYYGMNTVCFRCGCITGSNHQGVEQHGFLSYLCKCAKDGREYKIYGWDGKQVRDNLHAHDLVRAFHEFAKKPSHGKVYNIGGGKSNSCSIIEAIDIIQKKSGIKVKTSNGHKRKGDHGVYITNNFFFTRDYPNWKITRDLDSIFDELLDDNHVI